MAKYEHLSTTTTTKFDKVLRRHAYTMKLKINEVLELYQNAFLEKQEQNKAEVKKTKKPPKSKKEPEED